MGLHCWNNICWKITTLGSLHWFNTQNKEFLTAHVQRRGCCESPIVGSVQGHGCLWQMMRQAYHLASRCQQEVTLPTCLLTLWALSLLRFHRLTRLQIGWAPEGVLLPLVGTPVGSYNTTRGNDRWNTSRMAFGPSLPPLAKIISSYLPEICTQAD